MRVRIEVVLTEADQDIIDYLEGVKGPRSSHFKTAMRSYMYRSDENILDRRVKRIVNEMLKERGADIQVTPVKVTKAKRKVGFGAKKG